MRLEVSTLALCSVYAVVRYCVFKGVELDHLPLYIFNKAISWSGLVLVGVAPLRRAKEARTRTGVFGFALVAAHTVASLALLRPSYFPTYFLDDATFSAFAEIGLVFGIGGMIVLAALFLRTKNGLPLDSTSPTNPYRGFGRLALGLSALHCLALGYTSWFNAPWPGYLPPITLLAFLFALLLLIRRFSSR